MIAIVDYGLGNVGAFANIYKRLNVSTEIVCRPQDLQRADRIILPGVGAFDWAMTRLGRSGLRGALDEMVLGYGRPVLGVCVGMQIMADSSEEGQLEGLGWITGKVKKFDETTFSQKAPIPHMGWNDVMPQDISGLFQHLENGARFYFLHSYYFIPKDKHHVLAVTDYGSSFASSISSANILGVQFHPEKSHHWGIQLLKNFAEV